MPPHRLVEVSPERLEGWLGRFAHRHGTLSTTAVTADEVVITAADAAAARCAVPFPPLGENRTDPYGGLVEHAGATRRVGVLLVRLGGHAAGVFDGDTLVASKVGSRQVHGRTSAGGQSQQRFARRREGQARVALAAAADVAFRVLLPAVADLDAVVLGGDRRAVTAVMADARLAGLRPLVISRLLDVPDPRLRVLAATPHLFRAVQIRVIDPTCE